MASPRIPTRNTRFIDPQAERMRGISALEAVRGYAGAPSEASVMYPGAEEAYRSGELTGMAEMLIPGASMAKGALGAALAGVIKPRGGNWRSAIEKFKTYGSPGYSSSVEQALAPLKRMASPEEMQRLQQAGLVTPEALLQATAMDRWIEGPLTRYIKRDMATPEDPPRKLAEQGISHLELPERVNPPTEFLEGRRFAQGFPEKGMSTTPQGAYWEELADLAVRAEHVGGIPPSSIPPEEKVWMDKLSVDDTVYSLPENFSEWPIGFRQLTDELMQAMDPESGLPPKLQLKPDDLQQMGMEKAVRHVAEINAWRKAENLKEIKKSTLEADVFKDFPEQGYRWVELNRPGQFAQESDIMKHSVRGYEPGGDPGYGLGGWDAIESGRAKVYSLRDTRTGEPHVTIEVSAGFPADSDAMLEEAEELARQRLGGWDHPDFEDVAMEIANELSTDPKYSGMRITQIKGKANERPSDKYLPFVQDFVRSGNWDDVKDLGNAGLVNMRKLYGDRYPSDQPTFMTKEEQWEFNKRFPSLESRLSQDLESGEWEPEMASGGLVQYGSHKCR